LQCKGQEVKVSWQPAKAPYNLIVVPADDPCGDALYVFIKATRLDADIVIALTPVISNRPMPVLRSTNLRPARRSRSLLKMLMVRRVGVML